MMDRRAAFRVVEMFEAEVAHYTGAPHAVAVDSCTNALFLALLYARSESKAWGPMVMLPKRTYVGVAQAARNAGYTVLWTDEAWSGAYELRIALGHMEANPRVVDAAKRFTAGMYEPGTLTCVSFQAGKILPIGRGGAILTDSAEAAAWLRRARFDGRSQGTDSGITAPGWHLYLTPPDAARGLWLMAYLPEHNADQVDSYDDLSELEALR